MRTFTNVSGSQLLANTPGFHVFRLVSDIGAGAMLHKGDTVNPFLDQGTQFQVPVDRLAFVYLEPGEAAYFFAYVVGPGITYEVYGSRFATDELV
jgi:hypothetical protein